MSLLMAASGSLSGCGTASLGILLFDLLLRLVSGLLVPLLYLFLLLAFAESGLGLQQLAKLRDLVKWLLVTAVKGLMWAYSGILSLTGLVSGAVDAQKLRTLRAAIAGMVPVVGNLVSEASGSLLSAASLLRLSTGVYGMLAVLGICLTPFFRMALQYLILKLAAALCGLLGKGSLSGLLEKLCQAMGLLLALTGICCLLALMILRKVNRIFARVKAGDYTMPGLRGRQLGEMTAGVFGSGRIGRTTMQILKGFGCRILCYDPFQNEEAKKLCTYVTKEELLQDSDIVFLHCPLTPENEGLIGPESLKLMKDGACLVNTARGGLVDAEAVLMALKEGKISAFAFDVVEGEAAFVRKKKAFDEIDDPVFEELLAMENVVYTPHVAFYTDGAIRSMNEVTLRNLKEFEDTGSCRNEVK